ncbi:MAG TPA: hypothetical protein VLM87_03400, partial [Rubrivivax sp.]|nr:hypothetical protein [Rubrivivax sp.]
MSFIRRLLPLLLTVAAALPAWAARGDLPPVPGEVIVQFKADAAVLRKQALSARGEAGAAAAGRLAERAAVLGA